MDRHICKAKRKDNGEWVQGVYYKQTHFYGTESERYYIITSTETLDYGQAIDYFEVDPDTICNFIGIHDNNNQPIFENDIILSQERDTRPYSKNKKSKRLKGVVYYHISSGNGFYNKETRKWDRYMEWSSEWKVKFNEDERIKYHCSSWGDFWDCEVIGNIFDNSELL